MPRESFHPSRSIEVNVASDAPPVRTIDATYLLDLAGNLYWERGEGDADEVYANKLRELLDEAIDWFDTVESDINSMTDGGGSNYALMVEKIKKECNRGRAGVRFLKSNVEPNSVKTDLLVDYRQELRNILKRHSIIIAAVSRRMVESLRANVRCVSMVLARSKLASDITMPTAPSGEHITEMMREADAVGTGDG